MCRIAAFPPNFPRRDAIEILRNFENNNTDGTGAAWIEGKNFLVEKYPKALSKVLRKHRFLRHMPHNGWTIAHLRAASVSDVRKVNTHPFVAGPWAVCHNGTFSEHKVVKLALGNKMKFEGETDSEVAAYLINTAGPKKFAEIVDMSGVFLALNINGDLWALKTSGDLELEQLNGERTLMCSRFDWNVYEKPVDAQIGWYHFDREGRYIKHKKLRESFYPYRRVETQCGCGPYGKTGPSSPSTSRNGNVTTYTTTPSTGRDIYDYSDGFYMK